MKLKELILHNRFLRFGFLLTALQISGGALGYFYQILMGRLLLPVEFALFSSVMALVMFTSAPLSAMSMLIVRRISALKAHNSLLFLRSIFFQINKILFIIGIFVFFLFWIAKPYLQHYLKVDDSSVIDLFSVIVLFSIFHIAVLAFFQGLQRFIFLGVLGLSGVFCKILISFGLIKSGLGVEGALFGVFLAIVLIYLIATTVLLCSLPPQITHKDFVVNFSTVKRIIPVLVAATTFSALTQLDMAIVNWYFDSSEAGLYAAASVLGKAVLYLPGGLILVLFPMVSENHAKGTESFGVLRQAVITTILVCGFISLLYWLYGDLIIAIFYGEGYKGAGKILSWYGISILPLAVILVAEHYLIARGRTLFAWLFLFILPVELTAIYFWHSEIWMILLIMGGFGLLLAIVGCLLIWRSANEQN